ALLACVTGLPPLLATRRGLRRPAFDVGRVAGRRAGGVGGVLVEAFGQLIDLPLEGLQPLLVLLDEGQDGRLGGRRYLVPEFSGNWRNRRHTNILRPVEARTSPTGDRLPDVQPQGRRGVRLTCRLDSG